MLPGDSKEFLRCLSDDKSPVFLKFCHISLAFSRVRENYPDFFKERRKSPSADNNYHFYIKIYSLGRSSFTI